MNIRNISIALSLLIGAAASQAVAQDPWVHVYHTGGTAFNSVDMADVLDITFSEDNSTMSLNLTDDTSTNIRMSNVNKWAIGPTVATMYLTTNTYVSEIPSKEYYLDGTITLLGHGVYNDLETTDFKIRGRGNSTWGYTKKPYRIKFDTKTKLCGLKKAKNYCLLANFLDGSLMRNMAAFEFGKLIEMPYINSAIPVDVYLNSNYKGSYMLTQKVGINNGSVNDLTDEANSILFELDTYDADEDEYPFTVYLNSYQGIPVRIKDPDAPTDETELKEWEDYWDNDLQEFMDIVTTGDENAIFEACDLESLVRFVMTFDLACNQEIDHPKSIFLHKTKGGVYYFGPAWDFDWAFGYSPTYSKGSSSSSNNGGWGGWNWGNWNTTTYETYENPLIGTGKNSGYGGELFKALCNNDTFLNRFTEVWNDFYQNHLDEFWDSFDAYAEALEPSAAADGVKYSATRDFSSNVATLRTWIRNRIEYINSDSNHGLWE